MEKWGLKVDLHLKQDCMVMSMGGGGGGGGSRADLERGQKKILSSLLLSETIVDLLFYLQYG
jgi:hypothetical protein